MAATAQEADTIAYEFLVNAEHTQVHIIERYRTQGLLPHVKNTFSPYAERFLALVKIDQLYVYGDTTPEIREVFDGFGALYRHCPTPRTKDHRCMRSRQRGKRFSTPSPDVGTNRHKKWPLHSALMTWVQHFRFWQRCLSFTKTQCQLGSLSRLDPWQKGKSPCPK